jgi:hypothetical protein
MRLGALLTRDRSLGLVLVIGLLAAAGYARGLAPAGRPPAPCPRPTLSGAVLRCDGVGGPAGPRAWLAGVAE